MSNSVVVETSYGPVRGLVISDESREVDAFLGVPYAQQPTGALRLEPLQPLQPWQATLDCTRHGASPIQGDVDAEFCLLNSVGSEGEECIWVNIHRPSGMKEPIPVLVFIHGGGFASGSNCERLNDPIRLVAAHDIMVVTINYRLGALGFLYLPNIVEPNLGIKDQNVALQWVKHEVRAFGGDDGNITICGHEAGAASVYAHYLSPRSQPLFHKAIAMSGSLDSTWAFGRSKQALRINSREFVVKNGGDPDASSDEVKAFLRSLLPYKFRDNEVYQFGPIYEPSFLPNCWNVSGELNKPLLATCCRYEGDSFLWRLFPDRVERLLSGDDSVIRECLQEFFGASTDGEFIDQVLSFYSSNADSEDAGDNFSLLSEILGDCIVNCSLVKLLDSIRELSSADIYFGVYNFRGFTSSHSAGLEMPEFLRCTHGVDLQYLFGHLLHSDDPGERVITRAVMHMVTDFMTSGSPIKNQHRWPKYSLEDNNYVEIHPTRLVQLSAFRRNHIQFWDSLS